MRVGLRLAAVAALGVAFVLFMVALFVDQAVVRSDEYYCDDYDYQTETCDGDYEREDGATIHFGAFELDVGMFGEFDYDHRELGEIDGAGRLDAMGPLYLVGVIATGIAAVGLLASLLVRFPVNIAFAVLAGLAVAALVVGMAVGLSGAEDFSDAVAEDDEEDGEFRSETGAVRWGAGPILILIGSVFALAGAGMGCMPANIRVAWTVQRIDDADTGRSVRTADRVPDFDGKGAQAAPGKTGAKTAPARKPSLNKGAQKPAAKAPRRPPGPGF